MIQKIFIAQITVGQRHRKDMGDLQALGDSINTLGLLQPVGVTSKMQLVWGERRLKACQMLGWTQIDAVVDPSLDDILRAMQAEEDENQCRLPFAQSERVAIADHIESVERQRAEERKRQHGGTAPGRRKNTPADSAEVSGDAGDTREKVAAAVGMSHDTLSKARKVVAQGTPELVKAMDEGTASVNAASEIAALPTDEQREVVAKGKDAITSAAAKLRADRGPRRPGLHHVLERLDAIARMHPTEMSLFALREALADLRKELGSLLS